MSEYTPITGELRERIEQAEHIVPLSGDSEDTQVRINLAWLKEKLDAIDSIHAQLERENAALKAELDRVLGEQEDKALTYEEAKQLCMKAFDGGATYGTESMRFGVNARAYDWEHWLEKHESLFRPTDTWERIVEDAFNAAIQGADERWDSDVDRDILVARCKALCERTKEVGA